jgi:hypothetical protein
LRSDPASLSFVLACSSLEHTAEPEIDSHRRNRREPDRVQQTELMAEGSNRTIDDHGGSLPKEIIDTRMV